MANYRINDQIKFVNPYNFIRLTKEDKRGDDNLESPPKISGVIHCKLIAKTPICIPDVDEKKTDKEDEHPRYSFFKIADSTVIPGSSIRGVVRSMYETLTGSCFVTLPDDYGLTIRNSPRNAFAPAVLINENGEWALYKAERLPLKPNKSMQIKIKDDERVIECGKDVFRYGDTVNYTRNGNLVSTISKENKGYKGYLFVGEPIGNKRAESVFRRKDEKVDVSKENLKKAVKGLKNTIFIYRNGGINRNIGKGIKDHHGYKGFDRAHEAGVLPVWYKIENGHLYLSMAAIGRKAYATTVNDLLGENYKPCEKRSKVCPACKLFGMAKGEAASGKVRFTDAILEKGNRKEAVQLKELGSPRVGYLPFYSINGLEYDADGAMIVGRKFYWHNPKATSSEESYRDDGEPTSRNATVDLMDTDSEFSFDVFYDGISKEQLSEIEWVLTLGENSADSLYCYKIGHGKPLGLGSCKIIISGIEERDAGISAGYSLNSVSVSIDQKPKSFEEGIVKQVRIASKFDTISDEVRYPYVVASDEINEVGLKENDLANHQWFTANNGRNKCGPKPKFLKELKEDADYSLSVYELFEFQLNKVYEGKVIRYINKNKKEKLTQVKLEDGVCVIVPGVEEKYIGKKVKVRFTRKKEKKEWEFVCDVNS